MKRTKFATHLEFVNVLRAEAVTRLIAYGYDPHQAARDCITFGVEEVETQLSNLTIITLHGGSIRNAARWLNFAIRIHKRVDLTSWEAHLMSIGSIEHRARLHRLLLF